MGDGAPPTRGWDIHRHRPARRRPEDRRRVDWPRSVLRLLADPTRARVLYALDEVEELCVGGMALALDATEDPVSYALRLPRTA